MVDVRFRDLPVLPARDAADQIAVERGTTAGRLALAALLDGFLTKDEINTLLTTALTDYRTEAQIRQLIADAEGTTTLITTNDMVDGVATTGVDLDNIASTVLANLDDDRAMSLRKTVRLLGRVLKEASMTTAGVVVKARNEDVDASGTDKSRVPDVDKVIRLINRLVTGLPEGGAVNDVLVKSSATDYDADWEKPGDAGLATRAQAHLGLLEISVNTDQSVQDTLHLAEQTDATIVPTGSKYYVSGGDEGGLRGKVIRRTSTAFDSASQADFRTNFDTYWETILDTSDFATLAQARLGIFELSSGDNETLANTLLRAEVQDEVIAEGDKFYLTGALVTHRGKVIRRNGTALPNGISSSDFETNFDTYWEVILDDAGVQADLNAASIESLEAKTADLHAGDIIPSGWSNANAADGGLEHGPGGSTRPDQAYARAVSTWMETVNRRGNYFVARIASSVEPAHARVRYTSNPTSSGRILNANFLLSSLRKVGESSDGAWIYYTNTAVVGIAVATLTLQTASSTDHVGTSRFSGLVDGSLEDGIVDADALAQSVKDMISSGGGGGLSMVATGITLTGTGTGSDPLNVSHPFIPWFSASRTIAQDTTLIADQTNTFFNVFAISADVTFTLPELDRQQAGFYIGVRHTLGDNDVVVNEHDGTEVLRVVLGGFDIIRWSGTQWDLLLAYAPEVIDQTARDAAAAALPLAGGTMTGKITLDGAPTANLHAASKAYVDGYLPAGLAVPQWSSLSGTIAKGIVVEHNEFFFISRGEHQKQATGPDGDPANWWDLGEWWGVLSTQKYYPEGATGKTGSGSTLKLWRASEFIHNTDPLPTAAGNTKWKQIWPPSAPANLTAEEQAAWRTAIGTAEPSDARKEQIQFQNQTSALTAGNTREFTPIATNPITVISGEGDPEILSYGGSGNDFTAAAGVYLAKFTGNFDSNGNHSVSRVLLRDASDNSVLEPSSTVYLRSASSEHTATLVMVLRLSSDTAINVAEESITAGSHVNGDPTLSLVRLTGDPTSVAALETQLQEVENDITELEAVDATTQDIQDRIRLATTDILVGAHETTGWANATADTEGGIALSGTLTLDAAKAASYATSVTTPPGGSFYLTRVPAGFDPRKARTRNPTTHFGNLDNPFNEMRALGSDANWDYYAEAVLHFGTLTLQLNKARVVGINTWDGKLGPKAVASLPRDNELLWTHTAQSSEWHPTGENLAAGAAAKIYEGIGGDNPWREILAEVKWTETINGVGHEHIGLISFPAWIGGTILPARPLVLHGLGRIGGRTNTSTMNSLLSLPSRNDLNSSTGSMFIEGFNTPGDTGIGAATQITVRLWGVR